MPHIAACVICFTLCLMMITCCSWKNNIKILLILTYGFVVVFDYMCETLVRILKVAAISFCMCENKVGKYESTNYFCKYSEMLKSVRLFKLLLFTKNVCCIFLKVWMITCAYMLHNSKDNNSAIIPQLFGTTITTKGNFKSAQLVW